MGMDIDRHAVFVRWSIKNMKWTKPEAKNIPLSMEASAYVNTDDSLPSSKGTASPLKREKSASESARSSA